MIFDYACRRKNLIFCNSDKAVSKKSRISTVRNEMKVFKMLVEQSHKVKLLESCTYGYKI